MGIYMICQRMPICSQNRYVPICFLYIHFFFVKMKIINTKECKLIQWIYFVCFWYLSSFASRPVPSCFVHLFVYPSSLLIYFSIWRCNNERIFISSKRTVVNSSTIWGNHLLYVFGIWSGRQLVYNCTVDFTLSFATSWHDVDLITLFCCFLILSTYRPAVNVDGLNDGHCIIVYLHG